MENPRQGDGEGSVDHCSDRQPSSLSFLRHQPMARISGGRSSVVGPEIRGRGWSTVCPTVQVIERAVGGPRRFAVVALHPGRRVDLRHPIEYFGELRRARAAAIALARNIGQAPPNWPCRLGPSIDGVECGRVLCLEALA